MKLRCRKGDIAIIIQNHPGCEADLGRVVHVQEAWGKHPEDGFCWKIYPVHGHTMTYLREFDNVPECGAADYIHHPDNWLLPLRGERATKNVQTTVKVQKNKSTPAKPNVVSAAYHPHSFLLAVAL